MNAISHAPQWLDTAMYPYESKFLHLEAGKMHYIEAGQGPTLLFVHGTPTWSFLYRNLIQSLSSNYHCIAMDHLGFGLSDKPSTFSGTPQAHAENLMEFIQRKQLQDITLVVHDFGGPIGLAAGIALAERIQKIVLFNTWLWGTKDNPDAQKIDQLINGWLGKMLYLNFNFSPKVLLKKGFADAKKLPKKLHQHYIYPFPNKSSRLSLLKIAQALVGASDWYQDQWEQLSALAQKEWLLLWGTKDPFFSTQHLDKWVTRLPKAEVYQFECGHFVPEEKTKESIIAIQKFMQRIE